MKPKIKFKLVKFTKMLVFEILEQDDRFNAKNRVISDFRTSALKIGSSAYPELDDNIIYLRGTSTSSDNKVSTRTFTSDKARDVYYNKVIKSLEEWAKNAPVFKEKEVKKKKEKEDTSVIEIF